MSRQVGWTRAAIELLEKLDRTQGPALDHAAVICAEAIGGGGLVHLFGTGHSRMSVEEMFPRYGSYPGFHPMVELSTTFHTQVVGTNGQRQAMFIERVEGLAEVILRNFHLSPPDAMVVFSARGVTANPIEMAMGARRRGLPVEHVELHSLAGHDAFLLDYEQQGPLVPLRMRDTNGCRFGDTEVVLESPDGRQYRLGDVRHVDGDRFVNREAGQVQGADEAFEVERREPAHLRLLARGVLHLGALAALQVLLEVGLAGADVGDRVALGDVAVEVGEVAQAGGDRLQLLAFPADDDFFLRSSFNKNGAIDSCEVWSLFVPFLCNHRGDVRDLVRSGLQNLLTHDLSREAAQRLIG